MRALRLSGAEAMADLRAAAPRLREAAAPWVSRIATAVAPLWARACAALERLEPLRERLALEVRKSTTLTKVLAAISGVWSKLVAAFCDTIDPLLSRWVPDNRLVAVVTESGAIELHKALKSEVTFLGAPGALDSDSLAALTSARWTSIELRVRPEQVMHRTLSLPAAGREFLGSIIEHKLERLTPWRPDRVLYGYRVLEEGDAEMGQGLTVALSATSRDLVAAPLAALADLGLAPNAIGVEDGPLDAPLRINLLRDAAKTTRSDSRRMVSRVALASFAVLGVVWLATSLWASSADDAAQVASVRLMKARRLLKSASMGDVGDRERAMLEAKRPDRAIVVLIDKIATAIPEDTYLKELSIAPDKVRVVGVTTNAPALVGELESTGLSNVRFTAAVTREKDQKDSFEISADRPTAAAPETP